MAKRRRLAMPVRPPTYEDTARHYKETSVLKPVSPSTHTDNWPCFLLSEATVHMRDGSLMDLLNVDLFGPFIVRGKLEIEKDNERYLVNRNMKAKTLWIQIESSRTFSVGAKDASLTSPVVWASGEAGWFEIVPAPCYQYICDGMFQAVRLHYSLLDQYEEAVEKLRKSRKKKRPTFADVSIEIDELLFQCALRAGDGQTVEEARKVLKYNGAFFLSHFPKDTNLYPHLIEQQPGVARLLTQKTASSKWTEFLNKPSPLIAYDYSQGKESSSPEIPNGGKKGKGRPKHSVSQTTRSSEMSDMKGVVSSSKKDRGHHQLRSTRTKTGSPAEIPQKVDDITMTDSPSNNNPGPSKSHNVRDGVGGDNATIDTSATQGTESSSHVLVGALKDARRNYLQSISEGKQKKQLHQITAKSWQNKVYLECNIKSYSAVEEIFQYHARDLVRLLGPEWHDTKIYQWAKENSSTSPTLTLISEAEVNQIVRRVKKSARTAHTQNVASENEQSVVNEYAGKQTPRNRQSGKAAGLRPSTGGKKRVRQEMDFDDDMDLDEDGILNKKYKKSHYFIEEDDEVDDDNDSTEDDDEDSSGESKSHVGKDTMAMTQLVIRAEKLPSAQSQRLNQTWICEEPDCGYIVRAAHEEDGQKLINAHYEGHEKEAQDEAHEMALDRVNLAVQEARGHMPINHLLEKIRKLGENSKRRDEVHLHGQAVPEPIKRTLLI
ncbi:hypothetical protein F5B22DRAFT_590121 [Xylaria bambusicola]|uniref:uncharacterized protein n=1 Tax=Xylaria bambusicola TaxID=326684 RepID=UPI002008B8BA|nr:uncharacterized protein F5B22DRAFT_590121 [Xylaria bambusicola]KAI0525478.1 hypothetical protein F5B22DRAFT_590121 [Xylaria bambusicola]